MPDGVNSEAVSRTPDYSVFQNSPDYVVVLESDWSIQYANPSFQARFCPYGLDRGKNFLEYLDSASSCQLHELANRFFVESRRIDLNHIMPDSSIATVHYCFYPLSPEGSGKSLLAGVGRDRAGDLVTLLEVIGLNLELSRREKELQEENARLKSGR